jgi:16S rRNA (guanine527-N7)-methyltransferase
VNPAVIERAVEEAGLRKLTPEAAEQFDAYLELLLKWNSKLSLTAIREPERIVRRHFVECIQCAQVVPALPEGSTLLDFGSGAGFPGIPIAICRPEVRVTLAESQGKKAAFLREAIRTLTLDVEVFHGRVEELPPGRLFSVVALRAVDKMGGACRAAVKRVAPDGRVLLFATATTEPDLKATLPEIQWQETVPVAGLDEGRLLLGARRSN